MKQRHRYFAAFVSLLLLISGMLLSFISGTGWNLVITGSLLGGLCIFQCLPTGVYHKLKVSFVRGY